MALEPEGLANAMQAAFPGAWKDTKGVAFEGDPLDPDQKILYLAIARGLLKYLNDHENDTMTSIQLRVGGGSAVTNTVDGMNLNITGV